MSYLVTYISAHLPGLHYCHWVCRAPMDKIQAMESFKASNTSATVLDITECAGREGDE